MIAVRVFNAHPKRRIKRAETLRLARLVLYGERRRSADVNIVFVNDREMLKLNTTYLRHRYPTDVLSFLLGDDSRGRRVDGEVYVNLDQAKLQASEYNVTISNEVARLVIHGVLHLIGYGDDTKVNKRQMTARENLYLMHV
jgi:probable rRNA maturation factor